MIFGKVCEVFLYVSIGVKMQDLKFKGGIFGVCIGDWNVFCEYVSVYVVINDGDFIVIGDDNMIFVYSYIVYDCVLGSYIVMSNVIFVVGYVIIEDYVMIGGMVGIYQFCCIGVYVMISVYVKVVQDVVLFFIVDG